METLYNYNAYPSLRKGIFQIDINKYGPNGWIQEDQQHMIIGEDDDCYITKLMPSGHGEWVGDIVVQHEYILPIGIHKSRFVKWVDSQLELFK